MRRLLRLSPFTLVLAALLSVVVVVALLHSTQQIGRAARSNNPAPGVHAIVPSLPGKVPAYTVNDVRAYLAGHPFQSTTAGLPPRITEIAFITREQAETAMAGESLAPLPPGSLVCYVEYAGPFDVRRAPSILPSFNPVTGPGTPTVTPQPTVDPSSYISQTAHFVFDASTGNLLEWGYGD